MKQRLPLCVLTFLFLATAFSSDLETALHAPIDNNLPAIAGTEVDASVVLSYEPLMRTQPERFTYRVTVKSLNQFFKDGAVVATPGGERTQTSEFTREMSFQSFGDDGVIRYLERLIPDEGETTAFGFQAEGAQRMMQVDGRFIEPAANDFKKTYREAGPLFPVGRPVASGDRWEQAISVDPRLNPGGQIAAELGLETVYEADGERIARFRRHQRFRSYRPDPSAAPDAEPSEHDIFTYIIDEVWDIVPARGTVLRKSTLMRLVFENFDHPMMDGLLVEYRTREHLVNSDIPPSATASETPGAVNR